MIKKIKNWLFGKELERIDNKRYELEKRILKLENTANISSVICNGCGVMHKAMQGWQEIITIQGYSFVESYCHRCVYGQGPTITTAKVKIEKIRESLK